MKTLQKTLSLLMMFTVLLFLSCDNDKKMLLKERKKLQKQLEGTEVTIYKSLKLLIRSSFAVNDSSSSSSLSSKEREAIFSNNTNLIKFGAFLFNKIDGTKDSISYSLVDYAKVLKELYLIKKAVNASDEDKFPTILEVLTQSSTDKTNINFIKELKWNSNFEHLFLELLFFASKPLPKTFKLYEFSKINFPDLENNELKPLACIIGAYIVQDEEYFYIAEDVMNVGVNSLENNEIKISDNFNFSLLDTTKNCTKETQLLQLHAMSVLMRGYVRYRCGSDKMKDSGFKDLEAFLKDSEKLKFDNELVWIIGTYVYCKNNDQEKALSYLKKLENSKLLTESQLKAVKKIEGYLKERDSKSIMNTINDKMFIVSLLYNFLIDFAKELNVYQNLKNSGPGKKFMNVPDNLNEQYNKFGIDNDLKEKGKKLWEDITK